jgi:hypothetical protein
MAKAHTTWKVLPHGALEKLSERVWRVEGTLEGVPMKRVMTIAKRSDGGLVIHNGICLGDAEMAELEAWGKVAAVIVPNGFHRLDAKVFADRYPAARIVCPAGARTKVEQVGVTVANTYDDEPRDEAVQLETIDGTKSGEGAMIVRDADGTTLVLNDAVFNMPHASGFMGFMLKRVTHSSGGPRVSRVMKLLGISDKKAFRAHLERFADLPGLVRVVVSHHLVIDQDPAGTLRAVAATL